MAGVQPLHWCLTFSSLQAYSEGIIKIFDAEGTVKSETGQLEAGPILRLVAASVIHFIPV